MKKDSFGALWRRYFPITFEILGEQTDIYIQAYLQEMGLSVDYHLQNEDLRYFAGFVRQKSDQRLLREVARWEGALHLLETLELDFMVRGDEGTVFLAPSLQTIPLSVGAETLHKTPGLYALVKQGSEIRDYLLGPFEAQLLDLVQEDRKYTPEQLMEMAEFEGRELSGIVPPLSKSEREQKLRQLFQAGILQVVRNKELL